MSLPFALMPAEAFMDDRLTKIQLRVLGAILSFRGRDTNLCWPTRERIADRCGYSVKTITTATTALVKFGWLQKEGDGGRSRATRYRLTTPEHLTQALKEVEENGPRTGDRFDENGPRTGDKTVPEPGTGIEQTKNRPTSKTLSPAATDLCPSIVNPETWALWVQHRKELRKPLKPTTIAQQAQKLSEWAAQGHDPNQIILESISNGWQGLFEPKAGNNRGVLRETRSEAFQRASREYLASLTQPPGNDDALDGEVVSRRLALN